MVEHEPMEIDENIARPQEGDQANDGDEHEPMEIDENIAVSRRRNPIIPSNP